jgi:anti-sigma-K factor RskA
VTDRTALTHEQIQELLGAHAVDAVDGEERELVDEHLLTCDACRDEVDRHHDTLTLLVEPAEPAGPLRHQVLDAAGAARPTATVPSLGDARRDRRDRRARWGWAALAGAAAAVVLVVAIGVAVSRHTSTDLPDVAARAQTEPGARKVTLQSDDGALTAQITQTTDGTGYLDTGGKLPPLPAGQTYQLWGFSGADGTTPISLGLLGTDPTLSTFTTADASVTGFAISKEAAGGAVAPTQPILSGKT